ncbi:MAG: 23S rRNA (uracil(1939)-C(5))-methyltransferase RlmD [Planctomycetota bacterium]
MPIERQIESKLSSLKALARPFLVGVEPAAPLPPRTPRHDRCRILYPVQPHRGRGLSMGIYRRGTHRVEEIADCRLQMKALTEFGSKALEAARSLHIEPYDEANGTGVLRAVAARVAPGTRELLAGFVATTRAFAARDPLASALWDAGSGLRDDQGRPIAIVGVALSVNARPGNALLGEGAEALLGRPWQIDEIRRPALRLRVSFPSFYQHNLHSDAILYRPALEMIGPPAGLSVVDGYGGVGAFGLRLAALGAKRVAIVEGSPSSAEDARKNVRQNGLSEVAVIEERFEDAEFEAPDLLIADPPRAGLREAGARRVLDAAAPRVLLVSCSAQSLARDLAALARGYRPTAMRLCDLFPHTEHMEVLTLLERI